MTKQIIKTKPQVVTLKKTIPVKINEDVAQQIKYLCNVIDTVEWSGVLFYDVENDINDVDNFKIEIKYIYLMNKGTSGYTEYNLDEQLIEFRMSHPESLNWKIGHIHSHNSMGVFFSGTDTDEIVENSEFHNYYLSIIVNNRYDIVGKLAFRGKVDEPITYICNNGFGKQYRISTVTNKEVVFVYDCEIDKALDFSVDDEFKNRAAKVIEDAKKKLVVTHAGYGKNYHQGYTPGYQPGNTYQHHDNYYKQQQPPNQLQIPFEGQESEDDLTTDELIAIDNFTPYWLMNGKGTSDILTVDDALINLNLHFINTEDNVEGYIEKLISNTPKMFDDYFSKYPDITLQEVLDSLYVDIVDYIGIYDFIEMLSEKLELFTNSLNIE